MKSCAKDGRERTHVRDSENKTRRGRKCQWQKLTSVGLKQSTSKSCKNNQKVIWVSSARHCVMCVFVWFLPWPWLPVQRHSAYPAAHPRLSPALGWPPPRTEEEPVKDMIPKDNTRTRTHTHHVLVTHTWKETLIRSRPTDTYGQMSDELWTPGGAVFSLHLFRNHIQSLEDKTILFIYLKSSNMNQIACFTQTTTKKKTNKISFLSNSCRSTGCRRPEIQLQT